PSETGRKVLKVRHILVGYLFLTLAQRLRHTSHAPNLNPVEAVWSLVRRAMANTAFDTADDLDRTLRRELRRIQLRPHLVDGCLTATGLAITPPTSS
ncbi:hypothetical protein ACGFX8_35450, partial [Streptomyces sp. NPDC048362]